jgi:hypothetical protein
MSREAVSWGKRFLFFSLALVIGLFLTQRMLAAHANDEPVKHLDRIAAESVLDRSTSEIVNGDLIDRVRRSDQERTLLSMQAPEVRLHLREMPGEGDPIALLAVKQLYGVDSKGRLSKVTGKSAAHLPVLTGTGLKFNPEKLRVDGQLFQDAIQFIEAVEDRDELLSQQLSEIHCHPEIGLIAYFSQAGTLPVMIGTGDIEDKCKNLDIFFEQLGTTNLMGQIKYLDARLPDQIMVKKMKP